MRLLRHHPKAFSLLEVVMAMAAFTIIMMGIIGIMAQGSKSYRGMKAIQNNLETAQFALNTMAKELRTSSVISSTSTSILFFDYSQNRCIQYNVASGTLSKRSHPFNDDDPDTNRSSCNSYTFTETYQALVTGLSRQVFAVDVSNPMPVPDIGMVTVALTVGTGGSASTVQTTVSLRDFNYIGI